MTPELESIFETQIINVAHCSSSIFSREDVIIILKTVRQYINELPKAQPEQFNKQYILDTLEEVLNEFEYDEFVSCEPELQGSCGGSFSLEMNQSFDDHEFKRSLLIDLENYLTPTE
jgi:hypothetical protein